MWKAVLASGFLAGWWCLAAIAQPKAAVSMESLPADGRGVVRLIVRNDSHKVVVAYVYSTSYRSGPKLVHDAIFQDVCLRDTFEGMQPGGRASELRGGAGISDVEVQLRAALFEDGSVFGEREWAERVLRRREYAQKEYRITAQELTDLAAAGRFGELTGVLNTSFKRRFAQSKDPDEREWISRIHVQTLANLDRRFRDAAASADGVRDLVSGLEAAADKATSK